MMNEDQNVYKNITKLNGLSISYLIIMKFIVSVCNSKQSEGFIFYKEEKITIIHYNYKKIFAKTV